MGRPYRPLLELDAHLARGELDFALALARTIAEERGRPLDLALTVRFLPLIAVQRPDAFDVWTLRWLERWCAEQRRRASVDDAVEIAQGLAEIPVDPEQGLAVVRAVAVSQRERAQRAAS